MKPVILLAALNINAFPNGQEDEDWGADSQPCHDCAVIKGQLHVPGCDVERCPACGRQVLSCDCEYDGDDEE